MKVSTIYGMGWVEDGGRRAGDGDAVDDPQELEDQRLGKQKLGDNPKSLEDQSLGRLELGGVGDQGMTPKSWKTRAVVVRNLVMTGSRLGLVPCR